MRLLWEDHQLSCHIACDVSKASRVLMIGLALFNTGHQKALPLRSLMSYFLRDLLTEYKKHDLFFSY